MHGETLKFIKKVLRNYPSPHHESI